jgi:hypothetical protein
VMGTSTYERSLHVRTQVTDGSTIRWQDVPKIDDRPVAYIAAGSHGVWSFPDRHIYADVRPARLPSKVLTGR